MRQRGGVFRATLGNLGKFGRAPVFGPSPWRRTTAGEDGGSSAAVIAGTFGPKVKVHELLAQLFAKLFAPMREAKPAFAEMECKTLVFLPHLRGFAAQIEKSCTTDGLRRSLTGRASRALASPAIWESTTLQFPASSEESAGSTPKRLCWQKLFSRSCRRRQASRLFGRCEGCAPGKSAKR